MIITCPQCATRYQADAIKFQPAGRNVRCAKCGHVWHQDAPAPEDDPLAGIVAPEPEPAPPPPSPPPPEPEPEPEAVPIAVAPKPAALAPNPIIRRETAAAPPPPVVKPPRGPSPWPRRIAIALGWIGLIALVLAIGWSALHFRQQIATVWPQSASVYAAMGLKTNASGIDIHDVVPTRAEENGQTVLTVKGLITNSSSRELPVPQIRVALLDDDSREIYHWLTVPQVMTLRAGATTGFAARLNSPPKARHFEVRFARADE
jgi:predicted Zn finger-like uncharacterized protein